MNEHVDEAGPFTLDVVELEETVLVRMRGELDLLSRDRMDRVLEGLLAGTQREIVLDLSHLSFVDAHSVRSWSTAGESLHAGGRELVVRGAAPFIRRLLAITGVDQFVRVEPSGRC